MASIGAASLGLAEPDPLAPVILVPEPAVVRGRHRQLPAGGSGGQEPFAQGPGGVARAEPGGPLA